MQVQTFLPFGADYAAAAAVLDRQRLLKQRVETLQILNSLAGVSKGWQNHPAVRQWRGHEAALLDYQRVVCDEVIRRGYQDTCWEKSVAVVEQLAPADDQAPEWLTDERLAITHQASLYRKLPDHYAGFAHSAEIYRDYVCCDRCNYYWPSHLLVR